MNAATLNSVRQSVDQSGFAIVSSFAPQQVVDELSRDISKLVASNGHLSPHGIRNLASVSRGTRQFANSSAVLDLVGRVLARTTKLVRSILFDKFPGANWNVAWHQDLTIAVEQRIDVEGFGPWTTKDGVVSVQPPVAVLESMITLRLHLDDCGPDNGPIRVIPGSHRFGRLSSSHIHELVASETVTECVAESGDVLLMRPLLLHASSKSASPSHRRVLHLDFTDYELPAGLAWSRVA